MRNRLLWAFPFLLLVQSPAWLSCGNHEASRSMTKIDQSFNDREVSLAKAGQLELSLPENPTTGYRWDIKSDGEPVCKLVRTDYDAPPGGAAGQGGVRRWLFDAAAPGTAGIELEYKRPFERDKPAANTFKVAVRVTE